MCLQRLGISFNFLIELKEAYFNSLRAIFYSFLLFQSINSNEWLDSCDIRILWYGMDRLKLAGQNLGRVLWRMCDMSSYQLSSSVSHKMFNLNVSFLSHSSIKIVSQKKLILPSLSQKLVSGFFQWPVLWRMPTSIFPQRSFSRTLSFSVSLAVCLFPLLSVSV